MVGKSGKGSSRRRGSKKAAPTYDPISGEPMDDEWQPAVSYQQKSRGLNQARQVQALAFSVSRGVCWGGGGMEARATPPTSDFYGHILWGEGQKYE